MVSRVGGILHGYTSDLPSPVLLLWTSGPNIKHITARPAIDQNQAWDTIINSDRSDPASIDGGTPNTEPIARIEQKIDEDIVNHKHILLIGQYIMITPIFSTENRHASRSPVSPGPTHPNHVLAA